MEQIKKKSKQHASYVYSIIDNELVLYCSCCKKIFTKAEIESAEIDLHYCKYCGAIMDGSEKNN